MYLCKDVTILTNRFYNVAGLHLGNQGTTEKPNGNSSFLYSPLYSSPFSYITKKFVANNFSDIESLLIIKYNTFCKVGYPTPCKVTKLIPFLFFYCIFVTHLPTYRSFTVVCF